MVWSPTLHSKELVNECYSACSMGHQATTGENAQKNRKKKNLNNGTSAILWQVGENAATVE